jgi:outer membrane autotransporter protein
VRDAGGRRIGLLFLGLLCLWCGPAWAAQGEVVLPPGTIIQGEVFRRDGTSLPSVTTGTDANTYVRTVPPTESFFRAAPATVVYTSQPDQLVRFYTEGVTGALGSFATRARDVRGLTPAQVRDVLALPYLPDRLTIVKVPVGTCVLNGVAGPILGQFAANPPAIPTPGPWGAGGVEQQYLIGKTANANCQGAQFLPADAYVNRQPIGANALWYAPAVGGGNAGAVAQYLDRLPAPAAFGDLDGIYNHLDLLNTGDALPLQAAMNQLSGESHTALQSIAIYNAEQSVDSLLARLRGQSRAGAWSSGGGDTDSAPAGNNSPSVWLKGWGRFGRVPDQADRSGYDFQIGGSDLGIDVRPRPEWLFGATLGYSHAAMAFDRTADAGAIDRLQGGVYGRYGPAPWWLAALITSAFDHYDLTRSIAFLGRSATSAYQGYEINSAAEAGYAFPAKDWSLELMTGVALTSVHAAGFTERGAADVDLIGEPETSTSLRTKLGGRVSRAFRLAGLLVRPEVQTSWNHDLLGEDHQLTARFAGTAPGSTFSVLGARPGRDALQVGAEVTATTGNSLTWYAGYDGDYRSGLTLHSVTAGVRVRW